MNEISGAEHRLCKELAQILQEASIGDSLGGLLEHRNLFRSLEYFIPELFVELHSELHNDFLDGVYPKEFYKT